ncbi:MAG: DUF3089 domain-containing protein [Pontixanthobacter sp.]
MARKFLYFIAICIVTILAGAFALRVWSDELAEIALVPSADFETQEPLAENAYNDPAMWFSRPGLGTDDPARWQPPVRGEGRTIPNDAGEASDFAVFFIHPTSYLERSRWNAPLDDAESQRVARIYVRGMASAFNRADEIWAPRYRQATIGTFLTDRDEATQALDAAYSDIRQAFAFFVASVDEDTPIVLAGHSQGSLHLLRLLREDVAGSDIQDRVAAIYAIGWPISIRHDLPALGFPACATADQAGCIMSWSSYAEPADTDAFMDRYAASIGFDGTPRGSSAILCTNPLTGGQADTAPATENIGTLIPEAGFTTGELVAGAVPASCRSDGLLSIGAPVEMGEYVLPGNNYHIYDIPLFWANMQRGVVRRVAAWQAAQ